MSALCVRSGNVSCGKSPAVANEVDRMKHNTLEGELDAVHGLPSHRRERGGLGRGGGGGEEYCCFFWGFLTRKKEGRSPNEDYKKVFVCGGKGEREGEGEGEGSLKKRKGERVCVCKCVVERRTT